MSTNCYLVCDEKTKECLIIDPGDAGEYIAQKATSFGKPTAIIITHGHFDHMLGAFELMEILEIPTYFHKPDDFLRLRMRETASYYLGTTIVEPPPNITNYIKNSDIVSIGDIKLEIVETPGHTPGSISLYCKEEDALFSGDVVFSDGSVGDWTHPYSDKNQLDASIQKLLTLPPQTIIYPGHGSSFTLRSLKKILL